MVCTVNVGAIQRFRQTDKKAAVCSVLHMLGHLLNIGGHHYNILCHR